MELIAAERLRRVLQQVDARMARVLARHDLTLGEWRVLATLHTAGAVPPSRIAHELGLTRGGVTKLIDRLRVRRLLVRAAAGRADQRYQTIALTGAGAVLVRALAGDVELAGALTLPEQAEIAAALAGSGGGATDE